ncbi:MAG TPA: catalase family protein [Allosphingosinicella sp.]|nr:catalase family protein [Allosphingosinicella sp.]
MSGAPIPYHPDQETIEADEEVISRRIAAVMDWGEEHARDPDCRYGRRSHAKCLGALAGQLEIAAGLDGALAQGLFARAGRYRVLARLSHLPAERLDDRLVSSVRGLALRVFGVEGEPLDGHEGGTQDFVLDTGKAFNARNPKGVLAGMTTVEATAPLPQGFKAAVSHAARIVNSGLDQVGLASANLDVLGHPRRHPLGEGYYSQAPIRWGDYVAKFGLVPQQGQGGDIATDAPDALCDAVRSWCSGKETRFTVAAQLRVDADRMPIENARREWPEELSPYAPVGEIVFPAQDPFEAERLQLVEEAAFSPWHGLEDHRPLGAVMRARKYVYRALAEKRMRERGYIDSQNRMSAHG